MHWEDFSVWSLVRDGVCCSDLGVGMGEQGGIPEELGFGCVLCAHGLLGAQNSTRSLQL